MTEQTSPPHAPHQRSRKHYRAWLNQRKQSGRFAGLASDEQIELARQHIVVLREQHGLTYDAIAIQAGYSKRALFMLASGHGRTDQHRPSFDVAQAVLGVTAQAASRWSKRVSVTCTSRRLRACARDGWSSTDVASLAGKPPRLIREWRSDYHQSRLIAATNASLIRAATDGLREKLPPDGPGLSLIIERACDNGYLPWDAWPGDSIDDPDAQPVLDWQVDWALVEQAKQRRRTWYDLNPVEQYSLYRWYRTGARWEPNRIKNYYRFSKSLLQKLEQQHQQEGP